MANNIKTAAIVLLLLGVLSYAMYRGEQTVAGIALILLAATSYKNLVKPFIARAEAFARRIDYAKFRDLELRADQQAEELVRLGGLQLSLIHNTVLRDLEPDLSGLLVNLSRTEKAPLDRSHIDHLRQLRDRGLVEHDRQRLRDSEEVWLTQLGKEVAEILARPNKELDLNELS